MQGVLNRVMRYVVVFALVSSAAVAYADDFSDAVSTFRRSNQSSSFFRNSYGYAVFPTVGEGGFIVAGGHGTGRAYVGGRYVGDVAMTQVSVGAQAGAQAYSEIVFFQNRRSFEQFTSGNFEFSADASAVAITAGANASAGTQGASAGASGGKNDAGTRGAYHDGLAIFTIVKGGAMVQAAVGGQKFSYTPKGR